MKNEIQLFNYGEYPVRTVNQDGEVWFVAKDICDVLKIKNSRDAINELYDSEKNTVAITDGNRGNPNMTLINEPGLYKLIFKSRKSEAKKFQDWVFYEVLPSLRKIGSYSITSERTNNHNDAMLAAMYSHGWEIVQKALKASTYDERKEVYTLDRLFKNYTGKSALRMAGMRITEEPTTNYFIPIGVADETGEVLNWGNHDDYGDNEYNYIIKVEEFQFDEEYDLDM